MRRREEMRSDDSCLNRASPDEMIFVLLGRDAAAPATIKFWAEERVRLGKNAPGDAQLVEALECAIVMESERDWKRCPINNCPYRAQPSLIITAKMPPHGAETIMALCKEHFDSLKAAQGTLSVGYTITYIR